MQFRFQIQNSRFPFQKTSAKVYDHAQNKNQQFLSAFLDRATDLQTMIGKYTRRWEPLKDVATDSQLVYR